ncbi:MAG TPA: cytidine deaminase [Anaeromyxobacteraceae bacterium]|nr:cytidine deaminase [Anaeromyxobacteraceae bacterium]
MSAGEVSTELLEELIRRARRASEVAYCRYSQFPVGAALLTATGRIQTGCNVENASYGLTCCAERSAVFAMVGQGERAFQAIVIYTPKATPTAPCGACRQVLNEFGADALVVSACDGPELRRWRMSELLPDAFGPGNL